MMKFKKTLRDGNCLFNAVEGFLEYEKTKKKISKKEERRKSRELRNEVISYLAKALYDNNQIVRLIISQEIEEEKEYQESDQDFTNEYEYLEYMKKDGEWGGQIEIIAIANIINRSIKVYHQKSKKFIEMGGYHIDNTEPIELLYRGQSHYDFIVGN